MVWDRHPIVILAVRDARIAIVAAPHDQVELVAAFGSHLQFPQPAVGREGEAERIAVTEGPGFGRREVRSRPGHRPRRRGLGNLAVLWRIGDVDARRSGPARTGIV